MKIHFKLLIATVLCPILFCACALEQNMQSSSFTSVAPSSETISSSSVLEEEETQEVIYRGEIIELTEEAITVKQLDGYDYGQPSIQFLLQPQTAQEELSLGMYVQVSYNGALTRSIPPQATALSVTVLAPMAEGVLWSGSIISSETVEGGYRIDLQAESPRSEHLILNVPTDALEGLSEEDLVAGAEVLAVTNGAMTASLPPQASAVVLLPFQNGAEE